jgi:hypothetical protein
MRRIDTQAFMRFMLATIFVEYLREGRIDPDTGFDDWLESYGLLEDI